MSGIHGGGNQFSGVGGNKFDRGPQKGGEGKKGADADTSGVGGSGQSPLSPVEERRQGGGGGGFGSDRQEELDYIHSSEITSTDDDFKTALNDLKNAFQGRTEHPSSSAAFNGAIVPLHPPGAMLGGSRYQSDDKPQFYGAQEKSTEKGGWFDVKSAIATFAGGAAVLEGVITAQKGALHSVSTQREISDALAGSMNHMSDASAKLATGNAGLLSMEGQKIIDLGHLQQVMKIVQAVSLVLLVIPGVGEAAEAASEAVTEAVEEGVTEAVTEAASEGASEGSSEAASSSSTTSDPASETNPPENEEPEEKPSAETEGSTPQGIQEEEDVGQSTGSKELDKERETDDKESTKDQEKIRKSDEKASSEETPSNDQVDDDAADRKTDKSERAKDKKAEQRKGRIRKGLKAARRIAGVTTIVTGGMQAHATQEMSGIQSQAGQIGGITKETKTTLNQINTQIKSSDKNVGQYLQGAAGVVHNAVSVVAKALSSLPFTLQG